MKIIIIAFVMLAAFSCQIGNAQQDHEDFLSPQEAWNIINAVKAITTLEEPNMKSGYKKLELTDSASVGNPKFTFDLMYHDTVHDDGRYASTTQTFFLDARTGVLRIKSMFPEGDTTTMLVDDWIEEYGQ
jgi:hypothetical protein